MPGPWVVNGVLSVTLAVTTARAGPARRPEGPAAPEVRDATLRFNGDRRRYQLAGMLSLTTWAVANLIGGTVGNFTSSGETKYFHQMNALWNLVNLPLGIVGLVSAARDDPAATGPAAARSASRKQQRVYLINAALDLVYLAGGGLTWTLGAQHDVPRARGYGRAVALQGAFLLLFDGVMLALHERRLQRYARSLRAAPMVLVSSAGEATIGLQLGGAFAPITKLAARVGAQGRR